MSASDFPPPQQTSAPKRNRQYRGFAVLKDRDPERLSAVASKGGVNAHIVGTAHEFTSEEAKAAVHKREASRRAKKALLAETGQGKL